MLRVNYIFILTVNLEKCVVEKNDHLILKRKKCCWQWLWSFQSWWNISWKNVIILKINLSLSK